MKVLLFFLSLSSFLYSCSEKEKDCIIYCDVYSDPLGYGYEIKIFANHKIYCAKRRGPKENKLQEITEFLSPHQFFHILNLSTKISNLENKIQQNFPTASTTFHIEVKNSKFVFTLGEEGIDESVTLLINNVLKASPIKTEF